MLQTVNRDVQAVDPVVTGRGREGIGHLLGGAQSTHGKPVAHVIIVVALIGKTVAIRVRTKVVVSSGGVR